MISQNPSISPGEDNAPPTDLNTNPNPTYPINKLNLGRSFWAATKEPIYVERYIAKANMDWEVGARASLPEEAALPPKPLKLHVFNAATPVICGALASAIYKELELQQKTRARDAKEEQRRREKEERERPMSQPNDFEDWEDGARPSTMDRADYVTVEPSPSADNGKPLQPQKSVVSRYLWGDR
jgi:hypothetical protein